MQLYCKLDTHSWGAEDYTDEDSLSITGTIYSDAALTTVFDLTGYELTFRIISQGKIRYSQDDHTLVTIVTAASGTWRYKPEYGDLLTEMNGEVVIFLEKTGTGISAIGINGSADFHVQLV